MLCNLDLKSKHSDANDLTYSAARFTLSLRTKGNVWRSQGQMEKALKYYAAALEIDPHYKYGWTDKGQAYVSMKKYEEAIKCFDEALVIDPQYDFVWAEKGDALSFLHRYNDAIECYDKAIEIDPEYLRPLRNKASAMGDQGDYEVGLFIK